MSPASRLGVGGTGEALPALQGSEAVRSRKALDAILESAPIAMVMVDQWGRIVLVNAETEKLFGYPRGELLGNLVEVLVPQRFRDPHPAYRVGYLVAPEARSMGVGRDLFGLRKDGSEMPVEIGLNPIATDDGQFVLSAIVDITVRKRLEQTQAALNAELSRSNEALERSNVELRQFAYIASHDLQTPLRGIAGCSQILQRKFGTELGEDGAELIGRIVAGTGRLQSLIDDLLTCARVESRARAFEPVELDEVVDDAQTLLESSIRDAHAQIIAGELPRVTGDRAQLVQLLQNLIGNAVKYHGKAAPLIRIHGRCQAGECTIAVEDNGIGIEPKHREAVFDIFRRLHTQEAYPGNGIGLAVCRRVVNRHGGRIWVEGNPDGGSVFLFTLRAAEGVAE
jgi:PAS domain S-box-containing protein